MTRTIRRTRVASRATRLALAFTLLSAIGGVVAPASAQQLDRIAAVVDEEIILRSELDRAVANIRSQYAGRSEQLPPDNILERQVLERIILIKLQSARATATGVKISDEEVDGTIQNIARQNRVSVDQMREQLARDGMAFSEFRTSVREELLVQRLRQRFAQSRISVSDAEVDAALSSQAQGAGIQYHLAHILVALPEGANAEQISLGQKKIDGIKGLLDRGEMDFNAAAVRYSDSPNALEGGDLGWRAADQIPPGFANTIRSMQPGQIIGPLRGPSGFQLLKLVETRNGDAAEGAQMVTQFQARHILIRTSDTIDDKAAKAKLETLRARATGGADFSDLASRNSEDTGSNTRGGDLGWFAQDEYGVDFGNQVAQLADGQVSEPFKTQAGWHIVQRVGSRQTNLGNENRRAQIRESIGQRKLEDEWGRFLREMRGEAFIDIRTANAEG